MLQNQRGAALGIVIFIAMVCGIASYFMLFAATTEARHSKFFRERVTARQAAEAGLVIAMQRLWDNPGYCGSIMLPPGGYEDFAVPIPSLVPVTVTVRVSVSDCTPGNPKSLSARVDY